MELLAPNAEVLCTIEAPDAWMHKPVELRVKDKVLTCGH